MRSGKCGNFKANRDFKKRLVAQRRYVSWYKYECGFVRRYLAWLPTACGFTRRHNRLADANRIKLAQPSNLLILRRALSGMSRGAVYLRLLKFE